MVAIKLAKYCLYSNPDTGLIYKDVVSGGGGADFGFPLTARPPPPDFQTLRHACVENLSNDADVNDQEK